MHLFRFQFALTIVPWNKERITTEYCCSLSLGRLCHLVRPYYCWPSVTCDRDQNEETSIFALFFNLLYYYLILL